MRFNPKARLNPGQIQVRSGNGRRAGGRSLPIPSSIGGRGGIGGLILVIVVYVISQQFGGGGASVGDTNVTTSELTHCRTGADANDDEDCARLAIVNSIQAFWSSTLSRETGRPYREADTVIFTGGVDTGCGYAPSEAGPFYCSSDGLVYLDTTFFDDVLQRQLGSDGGQFEEAYVLAHEYGHRVQDLLGIMGKVRTQQGRDSDAVKLELQADCLAGLWAHAATTVPDDSGEVFILELTHDDIESAISAATAVGDDRIQKRSGSGVEPDQWTHGSAQQRVEWFLVGYRSGELSTCDTFA
jgi:hypothetical protein